MKLAKCLVVMLVVFISSQVGADLIRVEVIGHVTGTPSGEFDYVESGLPVISAGDIMTGFCVYDTASPDQDTSSDYHGRYQLEEISMQIGAYTFKKGSIPSEQGVFEVYRGDETYWADHNNGTDIFVNSVLRSTGGGFTLLDLCNAFSGRPDDAFPTSFPEDISYFSWRNEFSVYDDIVNLSGVIDGIEAVIVPEPTTLFLLGLGGFALRLRRK